MMASGRSIGSRLPPSKRPVQCVRLSLGLVLMALAVCLAYDQDERTRSRSLGGESPRSMARSAVDGDTRRQQQQQQQQQQPSIANERSLEHHLDQLLDDVIHQESLPARSLADCDRWANLNAEYIRLAGNQRKYRDSEHAKNQECRNLEDATSARLESLRHRLLSESSQLEFVSDLLVDYLEVRKRLPQDETLEREYSHLLDSEPDARAALHNLESFLNFIGVLLPKLLVSGSRRFVEPAELDLEELDEAMRRLVDRETFLTEDEFKQLNEMAEILEQALSEGELVEVKSGKFRYLSGSLDAARAVLVHKLNEPEPEPIVDEHRDVEGAYEQPMGFAFAHSSAHAGEPVAEFGYRGSFDPHGSGHVATMAHAHSIGPDVDSGGLASPKEHRPHQPPPARRAPAVNAVAMASAGAGVNMHPQAGGPPRQAPRAMPEPPRPQSPQILAAASASAFSRPNDHIQTVSAGSTLLQHPTNLMSKLAPRRFTDSGK